MTETINIAGLPHFQLFHAWMKTGLGIPCPSSGHYFAMPPHTPGTPKIYVSPHSVYLQCAVCLGKNMEGHFPLLFFAPQGKALITFEDWQSKSIAQMLIAPDMTANLILGEWVPQGPAPLGILPTTDNMMKDMDFLVTQLNAVAVEFMQAHPELHGDGADILQQLGVPTADILTLEDYTTPAKKE